MDATRESTNFDPAVNEQTLRGHASRLVESAHAAGAEEAEAYCVRGQMVAVRFEKGDLKLTTVDEGATLGLRAFRERRTGFASSNQEGEAALERMAGDAAGLARFSPPDDANVLPAPRPAEPGPGIHESLLGLSIGEAVEHGRQLVARTVAIDPRLSLDQASLNLSLFSSAVASSTGTAASSSDASVSMSVFGMAIDGDDVGGFDYWGDLARDRADLEARSAACSERFARAALGNLGAGKAETYRGPVLFAPAAFQDVFISPLVSAASAIAVQRGRSALAGKLGESVAAEALEIVDDPGDRRLYGACAFDREGIATGRYPIVEAGVLRGYLYNAYAAAVEGIPSTGHGRGGPRSVPGLGAHALCVAPGSGGDARALANTLGRGLVVQRFSGTVDPASGDFSGVAKSARWVEPGSDERPVRETLFSGNAFELLGRILALSSESEVVMGGARVPWALIDGVSVTAG